MSYEDVLLMIEDNLLYDILMDPEDKHGRSQNVRIVGFTPGCEIGTGIPESMRKKAKNPNQKTD